MFSVGLTGGIASGKTTISELFAELEVPIIDTDLISRALLQPDGLAYQQVCAHFGASILGSDDDIDRSELRKIVFNDPEQKNWLEQMLHPLIYQRSHEAILAQAGADYVLVVIPLLFETNFQALVDRVLVVDCPAELQMERLLKRDQIDETLARRMLAQQLCNQDRLARAQDIIENREDSEALESQVARLHQQYLAASKN